MPGKLVKLMLYYQGKPYCYAGLRKNTKPNIFFDLLFNMTYCGAYTSTAYQSR